MMKYLLLLLVLCFIAACDEPPPQWRDDAPPVDNTVIDHDIVTVDDTVADTATDDADTAVADHDTAVTDDGGTPDNGEDPDDEEESDDEEEELCTAATPTAGEQGALQELFTEDGTTFCTRKTPSGVSYFIAVKEGETLGYAFPGTNYGFDGQVSTLTGVTREAKSIAVAVVSERESWWYRMGQWFFDQFKEIDITQVTLDPKYSDNCWPCTEMYDNFKPFTVDAVSGATYTSNAVTRDVWDAFYLYDEVFSPPIAGTAQ